MSRTIPKLLPRIETHLQDKLQALFLPGREVASRGNAEALHQMRVASRRLRVALRCFASLFPEQELRQLQRHLRRTTRTLGSLRSLDVNLQLLRKAAKQLPAATAAVQRKLTGELIAERVRRLQDLRELLQTFATSHFEARIRTLVLKPRALNDARLLDEAREFVAKRRRVLRRRHKKCRPGELIGPAFHKFRIAAKRYRYALETGAAVFRVQPVGRIRAVESLQDALGEGHDLEVLRDFLGGCRRRWTKDENPLAGRLDGVLAFFHAEHKQAFAKAWKMIDDDRVWLKKVKLELPHE